MASCELCGKQATTKARIEGAILAVCPSCVSLGAELKTPAQPIIRSRTAGPVAETFLVQGYAQLLRQARQKRKLSEKDAAAQLQIKESALLGYESGRMQPDDAMARKLEKFYAIKLFDQV